MASSDDIGSNAKNTLANNFGIGGNKGTGSGTDGLNPLKGGGSGGGDVGGALGSMFGGGKDSDSGGGGGLLGGLSDLLGGAADALGDIAEDIADIAGAIAPLFKNKEEAEASLFNEVPQWLDEQSRESVGLDSGTRKAMPAMTHIRNWVRAEFLRREHNTGMHYTKNGEENDDAGIHDMRKKFGMDNGFLFQFSHETHLDKKYSNPNKSVPKTAKQFLSDDYVGKTYKGPKTAWARVCSNGVELEDPTRPQDSNIKFEGFMMHGVDNFHDIYGFNAEDHAEDGESILGYDLSKANDGKGRVHTVKEKDFKHRPMPGVTSIESEDIGVGRNMKKTTIKFICWSRSQVDYMDPYFFKVGNTLIVEWGWNNFPRDALIDVTDLGSPPLAHPGDVIVAQGLESKVNKLRDQDYDQALPKLTEFHDDIEYVYKRGTGLVGLWNDGYECRQQARRGKGNYSFCLGMISTYTYALREDGGYDCTVELMSMAHFATCLQDNASKTQGKKDPGATKDKRTLELRIFIDRKLQEILEGDEDPNEWWDWDDEGGVTGIDQWQTTLGGDGLDLYDGPDGGYTSRENTRLAEKFGAPGFAKGRFFSYGNLGFWGNEDGKDHMRAGPGEGCYITIGFLIEIFNIFYKKMDQTTGADMFSFTCEGSRCVAHPNIKSTNGDVLLIPNAMAPRRNTKQFNHSTIDIPNQGENDNYSESKRLMASNYGNNVSARSAFLKVVAANSGKKVSNLSKAMKVSPRDDLHRIMTLNPSQENRSSVNPFPDYEGTTDGYSGRVQDLFVNYDIVKDAVANNTSADKMLKTILKKMSTAACNIWDFDLVGDDPGSASNSKLKIIDRKLPANNTVEELQRSNETYVFKAHQKNSIVRSMSMDVSIPGEVAAMVLYPNNTDKDSASSFYSRGKFDRVLNKAASPSNKGKVITQKTLTGDDEEGGPSEEKHIVGMVVYDLDGTKFEVTEDAQSTGESNSGFWEGAAELFGDPAGDTIDIELVDPNTSRVERSMKQDNNPKNSVKYNMTLDGIEMSMQLDGIEGLRLWDMFNSTGVPTNYYQNGLWRITAIKHSVTGSDWTTDVTAQFAPNSNEAMRDS